jgi:hypothetical protein
MAFSGNESMKSSVKETFLRQIIMTFCVLDNSDPNQWTSAIDELFKLEDSGQQPALPVDIYASMLPAEERYRLIDSQGESVEDEPGGADGRVARSGLVLKLWGNPEGHLPYVGRSLDELDEKLLSQCDELRFWLKSTRIADDSEVYPFFLGLGMHPESADATLTWDTLAWRRLIPIYQPDTWELQRLYLGDLPPSVRRLRFYDLRRLTLEKNPDYEFPKEITVQVGAMVGVKEFPLQDVQEEFQEWVKTYVSPCLSGEDEISIYHSDGQQDSELALPCILIKPWSVNYLGERGGSVEVVDNYTVEMVQAVGDDSTSAQQYGVYSRPVEGFVEVKYAVDGFTEDSSPPDDPLKVLDKTELTPAYLLGSLLKHLTRNPRIWINQNPVGIRTFRPSPEEFSSLVTPGRAPLFCQLTVPIERGDRTYHATVRKVQLQTGPRTPDRPPDRDAVKKTADEVDTVTL